MSSSFSIMTTDCHVLSHLRSNCSRNVYRCLQSVLVRTLLSFWIILLRGLREIWMSQSGQNNDETLIPPARWWKTDSTFEYQFSFAGSSWRAEESERIDRARGSAADGGKVRFDGGLRVRHATCLSGKTVRSEKNTTPTSSGQQDAYSLERLV